jgi:hypothetical protein
MISASTWFNPYVLEVVVIPIAILLGTLSSWFTKKSVIGPIIHVVLLVLFYTWNWNYFYSNGNYGNSMITVEAIIIDIFFVGITWLLSWRLLKSREIKNSKI